MKNIVLFFLFISGLCYAQPAIVTPTPVNICDNNAINGFVSFNLELKNSEILGGLDPTLYTISYHETLIDAETDVNPITTSFTSTITNSQTIYVRVEEVANATVYATTEFDIILIFSPTLPLNTPPLAIFESPFDGSATFDLTIPDLILVNSQSDLVVDYYLSQTDAANQINVIPNPTTFIGTHLQAIWKNVKNSNTGCFNTKKFLLKVVDSGSFIVFSDTNFKTKLLAANTTNQIAKIGQNYVKIDTNNDNEIQPSEAFLIDELNVNSSNISNITGIEYFSELKSLSCAVNPINTIDVTNNLLLIDLFCNNNDLTTLNVNGLTNLEYLNCNQNQLTTINLSSLSNLEYLFCNNNAITTFNFTGLTKLYEFECIANPLSSLDVTPCTSLNSLNCSSNQLTNLNISGLNQLSNVYCFNNQLTNLDVTTVSNLQNLNCQNNLITSLDLSNKLYLYGVNCVNNNLVSLNVSNSSIGLLNCEENNLVTLNLSNAPNLVSLDCGNNPFSTLDVSTNLNLVNFFLNNCPNLSTLFMKNGSIEFNINNYSNCPNLTFICADEGQINQLQNILTAQGNTNCTINTYCSFTPGGDYNTITGNITIDTNNNGCDNLDNKYSFMPLQVLLNGVNTNLAVFSDELGIYSLFTNVTGNYQLNPIVENPTFFNFSNVNSTVLTIDNSAVTENICITPIGINPDVEVVLGPIDPARPGLNAKYNITFKNKGNQIVSGTVTLNYDESVLDYISTSVVPTSQLPGVINWSYTDLQPFENRQITVILNVNSPVEIPAVNIDDVLNFTTTITPIAGDALPDDNTFTFNQTVVGSFNPNDIMCIEGANVNPIEIGKYLHYMINFENTGNFTAENIVIKEVIDITKFDLNSLQVLSSSDAMFLTLNGNKAEFIFKNINKGPGGHGNVLFKIKTKNTLVTGDSVNKFANIYFDYNAPVTTEVFQTTFATLTNSIFDKDNSIMVYPNPTNSIINIDSSTSIKTIELYDVQGRIIETSIGETKKLDISDKVIGIYFLKITTEKGSKIEKIVKE